MKTLWFKQVFVEPIVQGTKTWTVRSKTNGLAVGDVVQCSVGPRPPFAVVKIVDIRETEPTVNTKDLYPEAFRLWALEFELWGDQPA